jgi:hypothetical protein
MRRPVKGFYALPLDRINHTNEANLSASFVRYDGGDSG